MSGWVRYGLDVMGVACGCAARLKRSARRGLTTLMYHRVLPDDRCPGYSMPALIVAESHFRKQMAWVARHAEVLTMSRAVDAIRTGERTDHPRFCLTFDDGYLDNFNIVAPILESHGLFGTFYVTAGLIESGDVLWFDRAAIIFDTASKDLRRELLTAHGLNADGGDSYDAWMAVLRQAGRTRRNALLEDASSQPPESATAPYRLMSGEQVGDLHRRGHEIGSHTLTHPFLTELDDTALDRELTGSKSKVEGWIESPVKSFCFPAGDHDDRVVEAVRRAGYANACTVEPGLAGGDSDPFRIPRRAIKTTRTSGPGGSHSTLAFSAEVYGFHDRLRRRT